MHNYVIGGAMLKFVESLKHYLKDILKADIEVKAWKQQSSLPFYLVDNYYFYETSLLETRCLLMISKEYNDATPGLIRKYCNQIQKLWESPIIYIQSNVSSYNRQRLIEQHIPFIVPGNQMYLPHMGIDLREYFRKVHSKQNRAFSPSTQALLIYALLNNAHEKLTASVLSTKLGYTPMTMTRALAELQAAKVGEIHQEGRERYWAFSNKKELWQQVKGLLRSPVRKRIWLSTSLTLFKVSAGLTALSHFSQIASPSLPVFAMGMKQWKYCKPANVEEHSISDGALIELELWDYNPELFAKNGYADPFSLYLSMEIGGDERIESALEQIIEKIKW
jgi:hypothetical protein